MPSFKKVFQLNIEFGVDSFCFSFSSLKKIIPFSLVSRVSNEKSVIIQDVITLCVNCHFSLNGLDTVILFCAVYSYLFFHFLPLLSFRDSNYTSIRHFYIFHSFTWFYSFQFKLLYLVISVNFEVRTFYFCYTQNVVKCIQ